MILCPRHQTFPLIALFISKTQVTHSKSGKAKKQGRHRQLCSGSSARLWYDHSHTPLGSSKVRGFMIYKAGICFWMIKAKLEVPLLTSSRLSSISPSTSMPRSEHLCLPHPQIPVEMLTPTGDGISSWSLWEVTRSGDGALVNGGSALIKEIPQKSPALSIMEGHSE